MHLALLSTSGINRKLVAGARLVDEVELVAVGSRSRERAAAQAAEFGIERAHGSYEDVLAEPEVDAVYIALPNALHVEWSIRALEAGKHVLCEKPLSRHP
jgi:xylose dehydrogenase (NAD/NADP)